MSSVFVAVNLSARMIKVIHGLSWNNEPHLPTRHQKKNSMVVVGALRVSYNKLPSIKDDLQNDEGGVKDWSPSMAPQYVLRKLSTIYSWVFVQPNL